MSLTKRLGHIRKWEEIDAGAATALRHVETTAAGS